MLGVTAQPHDTRLKVIHDWCGLEKLGSYWELQLSSDENKIENKMFTHAGILIPTASVKD